MSGPLTPNHEKGLVGGSVPGSIRVHPCSSAASIYVPSLIGRRSTLMNADFQSNRARKQAANPTLTADG
jgi:hypothetical protein